MKKWQLLSFEITCILVLFLVLLGARWPQISGKFEHIEWDEFAWVSTSLFDRYDILPTQKGLDILNDEMLTSFPTSVKINQLGFNLFGIDFFSARRILVIFGIFSMLTFYLLSRRFFTPLISFCITLLYAFSTYKLSAGRIAVEPSYADLFLYLYIALILLISDKNSRMLNYFYALTASLGVILGTFTYSLSFFFPVLGIILINIQLFRFKFPLKERVVILLFFYLPLVAVSVKWINNIILESARKSYALDGIIFDFEKKRLILKNLADNFYVVYKNLFTTIPYRSGDMLAKYEGSIIPSVVTYMAIAGIIFALLKIKKYYPILIWFSMSFGSILIFGFLPTRMWINTVGAFFLLAGISLQKFLSLEGIKNNRLTPYFLYFFILLIVFLNLFRYYDVARENPDFSPRIGEIVKLVSTFRSSLAKDIAFVSPDHYYNGYIIYPATTFYYLAEHPEAGRQVKSMRQKDMFVFTPNQIDDPEEFKFYQYKFVIVEKEHRDEMVRIIKAKTGKKAEIKDLEFYSLIKI